MKNILTKNVLFVAAFASITNFCIASPNHNQDTTLLAANTAKSAAVTVKEVNVDYPSLLQDQKVQSISYVQKYSETKREYLTLMYKKGATYFPQIIPILKQYNVPEEMKVLIALESNFNGNAVSRAGAVGYWQMMDAVAMDYGLSIGKTKGKKKKGLADDRKNFYRSTVAAARFLRDQYKQFNNDMLLAVASYNCGAGNVMKAIRRSGVTDASFWDIKKFLPAETRNYVMNFITLNVIFNNYDKFENKDLVFAPQMIQNYDPAPTSIVN